MTAARMVIGDCRLVMAEMEPDSFDAIVCDPPYDLLGASRNGSGRSNEPDNPYGRHGPNGGGFMGLAWDATGVAFDPATWRIALRVLKPGGHLVAFGGTRTFHRLTCAIEDAGFEIRDVLSWLYGSGFPKSLDVSKAIDKAAGAERETVGYRSPFPPDHPRPNKNLARMAEKRRLGSERAVAYGGVGNGADLTADGIVVTAPATAAAREWQGWGTALKPAWEPIVLARKPLSESTVAANVLRWGTGALNIDSCRIATTDSLDGGRIGSATEGWDRPWKHDPSARDAALERGRDKVATAENLGRWPANVALDEEAAAALDEQSGDLTSGAWSGHRNGSKFGMAYGTFAGDESAERPRRADSGGASRFFYTAKASRSERNERVTNRHPTVKPIALLRWLCRMVTPPGGHILDPFAGSGSTLVAALQEGFEATGIELSPEYANDIAVQRIDGVQIGGLL